MSDHSPSSDKSPDLTHKLGLSIDESCEISGVGRTKIYEAIGTSKLIASVEESVPSGAGKMVELQAASATDPMIPPA